MGSILTHAINVCQFLREEKLSRIFFNKDIQKKIEPRVRVGSGSGGGGINLQSPLRMLKGCQGSHVENEDKKKRHHRLHGTEFAKDPSPKERGDVTMVNRELYIRK